MIKNILQFFRINKYSSDPREEIKDIITEDSSGKEIFNIHEKILLENILGLRSITAQDVMVPRADIIAVDLSEHSEKITKKMTTAGHSRVPVFIGDLDKVLGVLHIKDLTSKILDDKKIDIKSLLRPAIFASPSIRLLDLLQEMRIKRLHLALVIDEFGGVDGLITIEDLVEEIVGEIEDEHDEQDTTLIEVLENDILLADARLELIDLEKITGPLVDNQSNQEIDTLGGLVCSLSGRVPALGECVRHKNGIEFHIIDGDARRIRKIKIRGLDNKKINISKSIEINVSHKNK